MGETQWMMCPVCSSKTRLRIRYDTVLERFPLFIGCRLCLPARGKPIEDRRNDASLTALVRPAAKVQPFDFELLQFFLGRFVGIA